MAVSVDGCKKSLLDFNALETKLAMRCDRAGCLDEASRGSIAEEADQTKSTSLLLSGSGHDLSTRHPSNQLIKPRIVADPFQIGIILK